MNVVISVTVVHLTHVHVQLMSIPYSVAVATLCQSINQSINQKRIRVTKVTNVTAKPLLQC